MLEGRDALARVGRSRAGRHLTPTEQRRSLSALSLGYRVRIASDGHSTWDLNGEAAQAISANDRHKIIRALEKSAWNVTGTSRSLGIPLSTLKFKMDKLEIRELARKIRGN